MHLFFFGKFYCICTLKTSLLLPWTVVNARFLCKSHKPAIYRSWGNFPNHWGWSLALKSSHFVLTDIKQVVRGTKSGCESLFVKQARANTVYHSPCAMHYGKKNYQSNSMAEIKARNWLKQTVGSNSNSTKGFFIVKSLLTFTCIIILLGSLYIK